MTDCRLSVVLKKLSDNRIPIPQNYRYIKWTNQQVAFLFKQYPVFKLDTSEPYTGAIIYVPLLNNLCPFTGDDEGVIDLSDPSDLRVIEALLGL